MLYVISFVACTCIVCCNFVYSGMEERLCRMPEFKYINQIKSINRLAATSDNIGNAPICSSQTISPRFISLWWRIWPREPILTRHMHAL